MNNWKDGLKGLGTSAARALASGAKTVINTTQEHIKESARKRQIVDKFYAGTIKELARQRGLHSDSFFEDKPTLDDYKDSIVSNLSLTELIEFARKKKIVHFLKQIPKNKSILEIGCGSGWARRLP